MAVPVVFVLYLVLKIRIERLAESAPWCLGAPNELGDGAKRQCHQLLHNSQRVVGRYSNREQWDVFCWFITVLRCKGVVKSKVASGSDRESSATWRHIVDIADNTQMEWVGICVAGRWRYGVVAAG